VEFDKEGEAFGIITAKSEKTAWSNSQTQKQRRRDPSRQNTQNEQMGQLSHVTDRSLNAVL